VGLHVPACEVTLLQLDAGDSGFAGWERVLRESGELLLRTRNDMVGRSNVDLHDLTAGSFAGVGDRHLDHGVESVSRTKRVVVAQESVGFAGAGDEISAQLNSALFSELAAPVGRNRSQLSD
jgi:hypothetical protein